MYNIYIHEHDKLFMYNKNSNEPSIALCGAPDATGNQGEGITRKKKHVVIVHIK